MKFAKKINIKIIFIIVLILTYLIVPTFLYHDSIVYYDCAKILLGLDSFSSWNILRGPTLSIILYPFLLSLGNNEFSIRICTCFYYIVMLIIGYKIIIKNKCNNKLSLFFFIILIVLNPVLYGYYHILLTEFATTTLSVIHILISCYFLKLDYNKKNYIIMLLFYILFFNIMWFLKQPYFTVAIIPCIIVAILKIKSKKDIFKSISLVIIPFVFLVCMIFLWRGICIKSGINYDNGENSTYFLTTGVIYSNSNIRPLFSDFFYKIDFVKNYLYFSLDTKERIIYLLENNNTSFDMYNVYNFDGTLKETILFEYKGDSPTIIESVKFAIQNIIKYPLISINSYFSNYLACIDIYISNRDDNLIYPIKKRTKFYNENDKVGLYYQKDNINNMIFVSEQYQYKLENLIVDYNYNPGILIKSMSMFQLKFYKIIYLLLPFIWVINLIQTIINKKRYQNVFLMTTFVLFHIVSHVLTGGLIDRYVYITFPVYMIALIIWINLMVKKGRCNNEKRDN